jgi:hypothetical protein
MAKPSRAKRKKAKSQRPPAPKVASSRLPPHPSPQDPAHEDWRIDEADEESFPASDPSAAAQPHRPKRKRS